MSKQRLVEEILNISVQGKKFTVKKSLLCTDPKSKLYEWFKPSSSKPIPQDKAGNHFLDLDGKSFRCILNYLRYKRERLPLVLALPQKPDDLATLVSLSYLCIINIYINICSLLAESESLKMDELSELCSEMLQRYQREDATFAETAYATCINRELEHWTSDRVVPRKNKSSVQDTDDW